jgi:hypothetical protein
MACSNALASGWWNRHVESGEKKTIDHLNPIDQYFHHHFDGSVSDESIYAARGKASILS